MKEIESIFISNDILGEEGEVIPIIADGDDKDLENVEVPES